MRCHHCGESVVDGATSCPDCGRTLTATDGGSTTDESGHADGLSRRTMIAAGGGAVAVAAGGSWVLSGRDSSTGPVDVVAESWETWADGDRAAYRALYHSESPKRETDWWNEVVTDPESDFGPDLGTDWTIENRTVIEQSEGRATVEETYTYTYVGADAESRQYRYTYQIELRTEDGAWKLWEEEAIDQTELTDSETRGTERVSP